MRFIFWLSFGFLPLFFQGLHTGANNLLCAFFLPRVTFFACSRCADKINELGQCDGKSNRFQRCAVKRMNLANMSSGD